MYILNKDFNYKRILVNSEYGEFRFLLPKFTHI